MSNIFVIAKNTFKETIRDRILYGILAFAVLYIIAVIFLGQLSLGNLVMVRSFGLAGIYIFGAVITIFLGASIIHKEIERRTLYFVLSKPVRRSEVVLGKFLGLFAAVAVTTLVMAAIYLGVTFYEGGGFDAAGLLAIFFQLLEMGLFVTILVFLSAFTAPLTATICSVIVLFIGHLLNSALSTAEAVGGALLGVVKIFYYLLPNLEKFNVRNLAVHQISISSSEILIAFIYAFVYSAVLIYAAVLILNKREL